MKKTLIVALMMVIGLTACGKSDLTKSGDYSCSNVVQRYSASNSKGWSDSGVRTDFTAKLYVYADKTMAVRYSVPGLGSLGNNLDGQTLKFEVTNSTMVGTEKVSEKQIIDPSTKKPWIKESSIRMWVNTKTGQFERIQTYRGYNMKREQTSEETYTLSGRCS
jgi:hypothetical protein